MTLVHPSNPDLPLAKWADGYCCPECEDTLDRLREQADERAERE